MAADLTIPPQSEELLNQLTGRGRFRDTGRQSSGFGESLDSMIGAPARVAVQEAQKGNLSWDAVKRIFSQIGADPKTAPTGYDIAAKVTDDPILGTMLATAVDYGAQMPGIAHITPGVVGEVRDVKNMGNVADAIEAFAKRGKRAMTTETKLAQTNGQGEVLSAMPDLLDRAKNDARKGVDAETPEQQGFWHDDNDHSFTDDAKKKLDSIVARYGDNSGPVEAALKEIHNGDLNNKPYVNDPRAPIGLPNYSATPTGVIGEPGLNHVTTKENTDPFAWMDDKYGAGKQLLLRHKSLGMPADIHTSSDLIGKPDYISSIPDDSTVHMYFGPNDPTQGRIDYPSNPSNKRLESAASALEDAGVNVNRVYPEGSNFAPIGRKPDSLNAATMLPSADAARLANFDPQKYLAEKTQSQPQGAFDPQKYLAEKTGQAAAPEDQSTSAQVQRMNDAGFAQNDAMLDTLLAGHLPQVRAKVKQLLSGGGIDNNDDYVKRRDQEIADMKAASDKYPGSAFLGKVAGFAAPMLMTGGLSAAPEAMGEAAPIVSQGLKTIAKNSAIGGALAGAQNPGDTPGVVNPTQFGQRASNAAIGAALGGSVPYAASKLPAAAEALSGLAETKAFKAAGAMLKDFRKGYANDSIHDTGRFILDNGLVGAGDTFDSVATKAEALKDKVGTALGAGYDAANRVLAHLGPEASEKVNAAGFNPVRDKQAILDTLKNELGYSFRGKAALSAVSDYLDQLAETHGDQVLNPKITNQIKTALDKSAINWERNPLAREPDAEAALKTLRGYLGDKVSSQVQAMGEAIGNPNAAKTLSDLNTKYGMASNVARMSGDRANREAANKAIGLTDSIWGGAGAAVGGVVGGIPGGFAGAAVGAGANRLARTYGSGLAASAAETGAKALGALPNAMATQQANPALYKSLIGAVGAKPSAAAVTAGPLKWANDGANKLITHSPDDKATIQKGAASSDPKVKQLLIQASDLRPGSKAMSDVMAKLKNKLAEGDE